LGQIPREDLWEQSDHIDAQRLVVIWCSHSC
jgi:hypothetical protein